MAAACLLMANCGMAEGDEDDRNSRHYLQFDDAAFEAFCLAHYDQNGDDRLSRYEAQRVRTMDCSQMGISSLALIEEFSQLESLNCAQNNLTSLRVDACVRLKRLDCSANSLESLSIDGVRSLVALNCSLNRLTRLDLASNANLQTLDGESNRFEVVDLSPCAQSLQARLRKNPELRTIYYRTGQQVDYESPAGLVER